jgi:hypothetical protein
MGRSADGNQEQAKGEGSHGFEAGGYFHGAISTRVFYRRLLAIARKLLFVVGMHDGQKDGKYMVDHLKKTF